jgi:hypothetical protein
VNVAVTVSPGRLPGWQAWCIDALRAKSGLNVRVVTAASPAARAGSAARLLGGPALRPVDVAREAGGADGADAVVDLTGTVDAAAPEGVWRLRIGADGERAFPFAREIAGGGTTCEIWLVRIRGGREEAIRHGRFSITRWYPSTLRLALREAAGWPATVLAAIAAGIELTPLPEAPPPPAPERATLANAGLRARAAAGLARRFAAAAKVSLSHVAEWNVGFIDAEPARLLAPGPLEVRWLPAPEPMTFIADPFLVERDGVRALLVEGFEYAHGRGTIDALVLDEHDRVVRRVRAIDEPTHLSYPYPVEIDGELYIVPENCAANEIAMYRCTRFPDRWEREPALFAGLDGVDTTIFRHEDRWWAFCTRYSRGSALALHAFHAASPRGPWAPHALNPIVVDVARARPAGQPFVVDGTLYRPGQDCSSSYGGAVVIARVDELTPSAYREEIVQRHDARTFGPWSEGIHTVSFGPGRIVVDGKRIHRGLRKLPVLAAELRARSGRRSQPRAGAATSA